jgi:hypothetical protein
MPPKNRVCRLCLFFPGHYRVSVSPVGIICTFALPLSFSLFPLSFSLFSFSLFSSLVFSFLFSLFSFSYPSLFFCHDAIINRRTLIISDVIVGVILFVRASVGVVDVDIWCPLFHGGNNRLGELRTCGSASQVAGDVLEECDSRLEDSAREERNRVCHMVAERRQRGITFCSLMTLKTAFSIISALS